MPAAVRLSEELFGDKDGDHASASEVSIASAAYPDHLKSGHLTEEVATTTRLFGPADFRERYPDGRMGSHPQLASVEAGQQIIDAVSSDLADQYRKFVSED
jgi:creatinine amidohydrolase